MEPNSEQTVRTSVRQHYKKIATQKSSGCCGAQAPDRYAVALGYTEEDLKNVPSESNLALGCGNPHLHARLKSGDVVLDLGSGGGLDCFLAAQQVGPTGRVIGVDMTPEMIEKARANAAKANIMNVEFRLGEIEHLPVADNSIDVIISNCVINLSPQKANVFAEAFRVLKPNGRLAIEDIIAVKELPDAMRHDLLSISCCVGGAMMKEEIEQLLLSAGFVNVKITESVKSRQVIREWIPNAEQYVISATIEGEKSLR
jgi:ubiquinone/menaquinone biosynthesis C-methylase UbiE